MNKELEEIIKIYATRSHKEFNQYLSDLSKNSLIAVLTDLLTLYMNDQNSSTLREFLTVKLAGYEHETDKLGYNGYKTIAYGKSIKCEAKPKNIKSEGGKKLNGGGNFTDYTFERLERDIRENINMLISGFVDGKLIYVIEFPFRCETFVKKLREQLKKRFPSGDITGQYLRSASFSYKDYINCNNLKIIYLLPKKELEKFKGYIVRDFYKFLVEKADDK